MTTIKGIITPIITPLLENENIDEDGLRFIVNHCIEQGLDCIFVAGSSGETMALTQEQRNRAIRITLDEAGDTVPVICGAMDAGTRRVIENIKFIEQAGGKIAAVTPVFYTRTNSQEEIVRHFEEISANTDVDIMVYNIPNNTQVHILPETVEKLSRIERVVGLKDSSGNWSHFQKNLLRFKNTGFSVYQGATDMAGISILCGADGYVPIYSMFFPEVYKKMYTKAFAGDIETTLFLQKVINRISDLITMRGHFVIGAKAAAQIMKFCSPHLCNPNQPISSEDLLRMQKLVQYCSAMVSRLEGKTVPDMAHVLTEMDSQIANF